MIYFLQKYSRTAIKNVYLCNVEMKDRFDAPARENIFLVHEKNLPNQATKMKSRNRHERINTKIKLTNKKF